LHVIAKTALDVIIVLVMCFSIYRSGRVLVDHNMNFFDHLMIAADALDALFPSDLDMEQYKVFEKSTDTQTQKRELEYEAELDEDGMNFAWNMFAERGGGEEAVGDEVRAQPAIKRRRAAQLTLTNGEEKVTDAATDAGAKLGAAAKKILTCLQEAKKLTLQFQTVKFSCELTKVMDALSEQLDQDYTVLMVQQKSVEAEQDVSEMLAPPITRMSHMTEYFTSAKRPKQPKAKKVTGTA
jgi:hypothetical protein